MIVISGNKKEFQTLEEYLNLNKLEKEARASFISLGINSVTDYSKTQNKGNEWKTYYDIVGQAADGTATVILSDDFYSEFFSLLSSKACSFGMKFMEKELLEAFGKEIPLGNAIGAIQGVKSFLEKDYNVENYYIDFNRDGKFSTRDAFNSETLRNKEIWTDYYDLVVQPMIEFHPGLSVANKVINPFYKLSKVSEAKDMLNYMGKDIGYDLLVRKFGENPYGFSAGENKVAYRYLNNIVAPLNLLKVDYDLSGSEFDDISMILVDLNNDNLTTERISSFSTLMKKMPNESPINIARFINKELKESKKILGWKIDDYQLNEEEFHAYEESSNPNDIDTTKPLDHSMILPKSIDNAKKSLLPYTNANRTSVISQYGVKTQNSEMNMENISKPIDVSMILPMNILKGKGLSLNYDFGLTSNKIKSIKNNNPSYVEMSNSETKQSIEEHFSEKNIEGNLSNLEMMDVDLKIDEIINQLLKGLKSAQLTQ